MGLHVVHEPEFARSPAPGWALARLEIIFPRAIFIDIYKRTYDQIVAEERKDPAYRWGDVD